MSEIDSSITDKDSISVLASDIGDAAQLLFAAGGLEQTLSQLVHISVATIQGCDEASIFVIDGETIMNLVSTDSRAAKIDVLQHRFEEGPSIDAARQQCTVYAAELSEEMRWPQFTPLATALGIRSLLALPLGVGDTRGTLNLYSSYPQAFGVTARARGLLLASISALALSTAYAHDNEERRADNLHAALATRELIGQAQGILIERERITPDQAFAILRQASQHLNVKLREVAQNLVDTGERPDTGQRDAP